MPFQQSIFSEPFSFVIVCFILILYHVSLTAADRKATSIGAIIDVDCRAGKEQKAAMIIAVRNINKNSNNHKFTIHFGNLSGDPLQAASSAEQLIKEKQVQVIIGTQTWQEATSVANVGHRAQVPVISFAAASITPPLTQLRWPFLIQMAFDPSNEMNWIGSIVQFYNWRKVIAIYEDDISGGENGILALLSATLQSGGSEIEHSLLLPPLSSLSDPKGYVLQEMTKLLIKQSRVFIVLKSSLPMAYHLFMVAKQIGLMERDSVWIITDSISSHLDSFDKSTFPFMQGTLGIKTYYTQDSRSFLHFKAQFRELFRLEYQDEDNLEPGIHALRAYDSITNIAKMVQEIDSNTSNPLKMLLKRKLISSNFSGLSGDIHFQNGKLSGSPVYKIVNIVGKSYKELGFWSPKFGFTETLGNEKSGKINRSEVNGDNNSLEILTAKVNWPRDLNRVPKGWAMPTDAKPMKIGVPGRTTFDKFVKVNWNEKSNDTKYTGFCIAVFDKVLEILEPSYALPYEFFPYNGTYDGLVNHVVNKTFDAVIGDVTILANRARHVEFTQPFAESGLSMLVPVKSKSHSEWMILKPFTKEMWGVTFAILFYTMLIIWFLEHNSNPEFRGPWKDQLGTAMMFTFSSIFFAHRERIHSNYTKVVFVVWLFVVLILNSSYTASLSSMLTVQRLEPKVTDIEWLRKTNATVGCDGDSFVKDYLRTVLKLQNLKDIINEHDYQQEFNSGNISAAFLELPYERVFLKEYCIGYTSVAPTYKFGGLGFVFQKGSPIAADVTDAILTLFENGDLASLEKEWLDSSRNCSESDTTTDGGSLSLKSFWGIYLISGAISTICFLCFLVRLKLKSYGNRNVANNGKVTPMDKSQHQDKISQLTPMVKTQHEGKDVPSNTLKGCLITPLST